MQHPTNQSEQSGSKSRSRPRGRKTSSSGTSAAQIQPEKTISELFGSSKHKTSDITGPSPRKRQKQEHPGRVERSATVLMGVRRADQMYGFDDTVVIDLTGSPTASPKNPMPQRRPNLSAPQSGTKKLVVKTIKRSSKPDPDGYFNNVWNQLDNGLSAIFHDDKISLEELYRGVENLCRQDKAPVLFQKLCERCTVHVSTKLRASLIKSALGGASPVELLRATIQAWSTWWNQLVYKL